MRVAIIGGGGSGMITAHLLDGVHDVTVFECQDKLGGHVRTLGKNADRGDLDPGLTVDNGVIEFATHEFVMFHRLLRSLKVETEHIPGATGLYLSNGLYFLSPGAIGRVASRAARFGLYLRGLPLARVAKRFKREAPQLSADAERLTGTVAEHFDRGVFSKWLRTLLMYAYSAPYPTTVDFPAAIGIPILSQMIHSKGWTRLVGGVYSYFEKILESFGGTIHLSARVESVWRQNKGVLLTMADGSALDFDKVVFAATPDVVLSLLADPSEAERRRFWEWQARDAQTVIHSDFSMYRRYRAKFFTEFDLFVTPSGADAGYNAYLNRLCGLDSTRPLGMAFNLDTKISPEAVLQSETHRVPAYSVAAVAHRPEVVECNGENHTFHAGAWLGDGLHEGATRSAVAVAERLGGLTLSA